MAFLLAFFFVTAWSLKTMHGFLVHTDHHDRPVCTAEYDHATQHIHDMRYAADGCTLCAFILSVPALPALMALLEPAQTKPVEEASACYQSPTAGTVIIRAAPSRGPPVH